MRKQDWRTHDSHSPGSSPGNYEGSFFIYHTAKGDTSGKPSCEWEIPLYVRLYEPGKLIVKDGETETVVSTVPNTWPNSWLNFILPTKIKGNSFSVKVKNEGTIPVEVEDFSVEIRGESNNQYLTKENLIMQKPKGGLIVEPGRTEIVTFSFAKKRVDVDSYAGDVYLHLAKRNDLLTAKVKINRRMGVFWALLALVLGILAGRMLRDVNSEAGKLQIELMQKLTPLELKAGKIEDVETRSKLLAQLSALEGKINEVSEEADKAAIEAEMPVMSNRVTLLMNWEGMWKEVSLKMNEAKLSRSDPDDAILIKKIENEVNGIRDNILLGKNAEANAGIKNMDEHLKELKPQKTKTKNIELGPDGQPIAPPQEVPDVMLSMEKFKKSMEEEGKPTKDAAQGGTDKSSAWKWWLQVITFFERFRASARVRYAIFRPIAMIMAFTVLLLLGFQEIYVNGNNAGTFGADGIFDAMKLFLWGVVSDVFSRNILGNFTSNQKVASFAGGNTTS